MKRTIFILLLALIVLFIYKLSDDTVLIPESAIRLRVIPNSNNSNDIYIKEQVKDYLEKNVYKITNNITNIEEARMVIQNDIPNIKNNIDNIFTSNNYNLDYQINYGYNYFPEKVYKGNIYKEGLYESLVISIGEAKGDNWWCVLFPNYCLIDTNKSTEYKIYIKELLHKKTKEE